MTSEVSRSEYLRQRELAYIQRRGTVSQDELENIKKCLNLTEQFTLSPFGNINNSFISDNYVLKTSRGTKTRLIGAKIAYDMLKTEHIPKVIEHRVIGDIEVLLMKRSEGTTWQGTITKMNTRDQKKVWTDVVKLVKLMSQTTFTKVKSFAESIEYDTFAEKTRADLDTYCKIINDLELCNKEHVEKAKQYVLKRLEPLFSSEKIVFVHDDVHMGNVIVSKDGRATLIDFDEAGSGPLVFMFTTMFGFLDNPSQYTDGTPQQADFEHVQFHHLFPIWYHEFASVFNVIHRRERLILQLNLLYIVEGLQTISENWSPVLNDNLMKSILEHELYEQEVDIVLKSYYGKLVHRLLNSL